jgi:hypothetical protein
MENTVPTGYLPANPQPVAVFDFTAFEDTTTAEVRIKNPSTGAPTPMVVTLAGPEHPDRKRIIFAKQRRMRAVLAKTGQVKMGDPEEDEAEELDLLIACTLGWQGAPVAYSPKAARELYSDPKRRWLRDQVQTALQERELFTRACGPA